MALDSAPATMSAGTPLDLAEWDRFLAKMHRHHDNVGIEVSQIVQTIRKEMKEELIPMAEERANYGKVVKNDIRIMWTMEYEIAEIQAEFSKGVLGKVDIANLTDDIVEDIMLQSKPLQVILQGIRARQRVSLEELKIKYSEKVDPLEPLVLTRPPKPEPKPEPPKEEKKEEAKAEAKADEPANAPAPAADAPPPAAEVAA